MLMGSLEKKEEYRTRRFFFTSSATNYFITIFQLILLLNLLRGNYKVVIHFRCVQDRCAPWEDLLVKADKRRLKHGELLRYC